MIFWHIFSDTPANTYTNVPSIVLVNSLPPK